LCGENRIFVPTEKITMKSLITLLAICTFFQATAQNAGKATTDSIGTTAHGLPVHRSYVPADAAERAKKKYGRALYSIEKSTAADCRESYLVGLIRNGKLTMEWMCDDPKMVFRTMVPLSLSSLP
jgi:hypothetical protein